MSTPTPPTAPLPPAAPGPAGTAPALGAAASAPRMPSFMTGALRVFDLSLGRMLWSRGTVFMGLLVGLPVVISLLLRAVQFIGLGSPEANHAPIPGPALFGAMMWLLYLRFIVPVLAVFYGTSLIADEVEDKTITYLFTRPIPRGAVMAGKYLAYVACTIMVVLPSVMVVYFLVVPFGGGNIAGTFPDLLKDLLLLAIGLVAYGALFSWVGARFSRPLLTGLLFVFGWEQIALIIPGYLKRLTIIYYVQSLVPHAMPADNILGVLQSLMTDTPSLFSCLFGLAVITGLFLWGAIRAVERREYVLEQ